jgi:hypothetical protein
MPKPIRVSMLGVRPARAMASAMGSMRARDAVIADLAR